MAAAVTEEFVSEFLVKGYQAFASAMKGADRSMDTLGKQGKSAGNLITTTLGVALGQTLVKAAGMALNALNKVGRAMAGFVIDGFNLAVDFQSQMTTLEIAASSTGLAFDTLKAAAIAVGGDTDLLGVSASGAAEAMTGLFKAGLTEVEVLGDLEGYLAGTAELTGALRASIDLAAASELDMVQASDLAAIALAAFGGELESEAERAEFVNRAMNNLVMAADASVAEVSGLAEALKMVGATAGSVGYDIEDINNALAILSTRGIQGSMAGTSLNGMINSLRTLTPAAQEAIDDFGISLRDLSTGELLPLVDILGNFEEALDGATSAERDAALGAIFTTQGMRAMDTLLQKGVVGWNDMAEATANAATIQEQAAAKAATFAGQMEALEGVLETIQIQIGDALLPVATDLLTWISRMVDVYGPDLVTFFERVGTAISGFIKPLLEGIDSFVWMLGVGVDPLTALGIALNTAFGPEISERVLGIVDAITGFVDMVKEIFGPIAEWISQNIELNDVLIALGILLAAVIIPALWSIVLAVAPIIAQFLILVGLVALIRTAWEEDFLGIRTLVETTLADIQQWWADHGVAITEKALEIWGTVKTFVEAQWVLIKEVIAGAILAVETWWAAHGVEITTEALEIWGTVKTIVEDQWVLINQALVDAGIIAVQWWTDHGDEVIAIAEATWVGVLAAFAFYEAQFIRLFAAFALAFEGSWYAFGVKLREIWDAAWALIVSGFEIWWGIIVAKFDEADWEKLGTDVVLGIARGIYAGDAFVRDAIMSVVRAALAAVSGFFGGGNYQPPQEGGPKEEAPAYPKAPPVEGPAPAPVQGPTPSPGTVTPGRPQYEAGGTNYALGGLTWVGEERPELLNIPRGSQIFSWQDSLALIQGAAEMTRGLSDAGITMDMLDFITTNMAGQLQAALPMLSSQQGPSRYETNHYTTKTYQLTTQSVTRPGSLRMEFEAMELIGAIAA